MMNDRTTVTPGEAGLDLTVIILTYNESRHLARCIDSVRDLARRILVVDSNSTDGSRDLAASLGADVLNHDWVNHATQFNWALDHGRLDTQWVMRLDADEIVCASLAAALRRSLPQLPNAVQGLTVNRQIHFLGRWIRHGDIYPRRMLRLWRHPHGRCEQRWMDEHIVVAGEVRHLEGDIADINLNNVGWWIAKHNHYATLEAIEALQPSVAASAATSRQAMVNRWIKLNLYGRLPIGVRAAMYFTYRYVARLGFLDGWQGLAFHALQGLWYRFIVDVKVWELQRLMQQRQQSLQEVVLQEYGIRV
jgi:glycosyltransferase involved in cell wall biosynthesis